MESFRLILLFASAALFGAGARWLAGAIAVRLGHPREAGWRAAASGGLSLLVRPLTAEEQAAKRSARTQR